MEKIFDREHSYNVYKKENKIINEQIVRIMLNDAQDVKNALEEVRINIKRLENQRVEIERMITAMRKEEGALLEFLKTKE